MNATQPKSRKTYMRKNTLKNNKALRTDNMLSELIKYEGEGLLKIYS